MASAATGPGNSSGILLLLLPLLLLAFLFFTQRRRQRRIAQIQDELQVGDDVMTSAGLFGRISALDERIVHLEIAPGVVVRLDRRAVLATEPPEVATPPNDEQ
ncbi:preprotein translocase subunit YajC [Ornithinimicrobium sediminis]|uniref:preprotein translocase subunit YajC n=1 Tax=Ornithinimicrobium sediminis TaxID=2904603 RepID=UPI001E3E7B02|nr:preprotein translocase subunit YajC [Ornithinimicrobium sediminis]MCE0487769.1 preprotein translocase subunit YajC [Ornithinimicrobium sediminis]